MTDGLEAAREKEVAVAAWMYAVNHMPVDDGFFEEIMDKAFKAGVEWAEERASESALRAAAQRMNAILWREDLAGFDYTAEYDEAAKQLKAALDGDSWEPSEEMVARASRAMWQFDVDHGQYTSPEPPSPPEPDDYEWRQARAALKAAMGIESGSAG